MAALEVLGLFLKEVKEAKRAETALKHPLDLSKRG